MRRFVGRGGGKQEGGQAETCRKEEGDGKRMPRDGQRPTKVKIPARKIEQKMKQRVHSPPPPYGKTRTLRF
jgi:hypothetical protein